MTAFDSNVNSRSMPETFAEAQRYFMGDGTLNNTLAQLAADLKRHDIDYVVIGAVALLAHGYPRFTESIDLVLTVEGLAKFDMKLLGRGGFGLVGYDRAIPGSSKRLRSFPDGVSIQVMTTGEYPGDGKPKPVIMPDPRFGFCRGNGGVQFVTLEKLIELKLASGMTAPHRLKDLADVQELIKIRGLKPEFSEKLDPYVREKFLELYETIKQSPKE